MWALWENLAGRGFAAWQLQGGASGALHQPNQPHCQHLHHHRYYRHRHHHKHNHHQVAMHCINLINLIAIIFINVGGNLPSIVQHHQYHHIYHHHQNHHQCHHPMSSTLSTQFLIANIKNCNHHHHHHSCYSIKPGVSWEGRHCWWPIGPCLKHRSLVRCNLQRVSPNGSRFHQIFLTGREGLC